MIVFENIENCIRLFATILGLLSCLFKYIRVPRRSYLFLIIFFLCSFSSEYYWTIYTLVMHASPDVSELLAYSGWNIGYVFLSLAVYQMLHKEARRYFHPVILLPVVTNLPQFLLYVQFGGIINNLFQVGMSTAVMVLCMKGIVYYLKNKKKGARVPYLSVLVFLFMLTGYGMWTSSCFYWKSDFLNPYLYFAVLGALIMPSFSWGAEKDYGAGSPDDTGTGWAEVRFQTLFQAVVVFVISGACAGGYFIAHRIRQTMPEIAAGGNASDSIIRMLFGITIVLILFILLLLYEINLHYHTAKKKEQEMDERKRSRYNFIFTIAITLALMVFDVLFNTRIVYNASVAGSYEDGKDVVISTAAELENYLVMAESTLRVVADTIDIMVRKGYSSQDILQYLTDQTKKQSEQFDDNFTGLYAYIDGEYMDGSGWVPPQGYDPVSRDWYRAAVEAGGEVVIVSPCVDAKTGSAVVTITKSVSTGKENSDSSIHNVVSLDVLVNHIQKVTEQVNITGKGFGMVVNKEGFIVAHKERELVGQNISDIYGRRILDSIVNARERRFKEVLNDETCTLFVYPIMEQWNAVTVITNNELFEKVHSQLTVDILVSLMTFWLIMFFYYFGYKNEQNNSRRIEELNMQVVGALAEAIDAKDTYTNGHSSRVAKYSRMIAARSGYSESEQNEIYMMGLLHDVGKIGVPDEVINKPSRLTDEEYEIIKKHPEVGGRILGSIKERPGLATGARWHHERYGGGGYPDGIAGEEIPEAARIIAVADAYDAMTSRRSYRDVMPQKKARAEIEKGIGTQFDPRFAKEMIRLIDEDTDYSMREK